MKNISIIVILLTTWFSGLTQFSNQSNLYTIFASTAGSNYGCGLSLVDFNQDGADDLSLCLPDSTPRFFTYNGTDFDEVFLYQKSIVIMESKSVGLTMIMTAN